MSQFVDTGSRLINTHNITNIIFLDEAKRIIFETEDMMFSITEDFIKREDYERACNNLRTNLNVIII